MPNNRPDVGPDLQAIARRAMIEANFEIDLPTEARAEVSALSDQHTPDTDAAMRDLRELLWSSIDNPESRDLDQVAWAEQLPDGAVRVLVGIADVDACAPKGSALDRFAAANTTSVYTGITVFPMLPERLSTDLSSLNLDEDRLAVVIELVVTAEGAVRSTDVFRARVRNRARLDYEAVGAWLEGGAPPPEIMREPGLADQVRLQDQAMSALRAQRRREGMLDFETIEPRPIMEQGRVVDLVVQRKNRARALIEQMMVSTNSAIASLLEARGAPSIARELPPPARWDRIVDIAAREGTRLPATPDSLALAGFLDDKRLHDPANFPDLSLSIVKLLGRSHYQAIAPGGDDAGHFGLAIEDYTHATAPNRRYPDLIIQRLLKAAIAHRPPPYSFEELVAMAEHCSERTTAANSVERRMRKATAIVLLAGREGEVFNAIVTGVTPKGTYARLVTPPAEGRIVRGEEGLAVGDRTRVRLIDTNLERGWIDFEKTR